MESQKIIIFAFPFVSREKDRLKDESDKAKQKNRENLAQTEEGLKAFKEQIETLR